MYISSPSSLPSMSFSCYFRRDLSIRNISRQEADLETMGFPSDSDSKNLPVMQEAQVLSPGWEDPLEKGMATHSSIPVCRILWTEEPSGL